MMYGVWLYNPKWFLNFVLSTPCLHTSLCSGMYCIVTNQSQASDKWLSTAWIAQWLEVNWIQFFDSSMGVKIYCLLRLGLTGIVHLRSDKLGQSKTWIGVPVALFDMPNSNRFVILSISIFSKKPYRYFVDINIFTKGVDISSIFRKIPIYRQSISIFHKKRHAKNHKSAEFFF